LKRRYLKVYDIGGEKRYLISVFEWGSDGWNGSSTFISERINYFISQRAGKLIADDNP